tara:strand:+ start:2105 stop:2464 length:360 start_codon:yes stop_codon:yes gene_type:complete
MRTNYDYKSDDEVGVERAMFESCRYYMQQTEPESADEWFDPEVIDRWVHNKQNVQFNIRGKNIDRISTTRIPTRCTKCKRAWAVEVGKRNKFGPEFLDPHVYNNIPCVEGDCHECSEIV